MFLTSSGNFADWWEAGPVERFGKLSQCFVDQVCPYDCT